MSAKPPQTPDKITAADLRNKLDEVGFAAQETLAESQAQLLSGAIATTMVVVWIAYRLGKKRGRRAARRG